MSISLEKIEELRNSAQHTVDRVCGCGLETIEATTMLALLNLAEQALWRPIEEKDKNGSWFLLAEATGTYVDMGHWRDGSWVDYRGREIVGRNEPPITHCMKPPPPPEEEVG